MVLSNLVTFITGAGQGLGRATAIRLASLNSKVVVTDVSEAALKKVVEEIGHKNAFAVVMDVTNEEQVKSAIDATINKWGKLNVCINCAGIAPAMKTLSKRGPHTLDLFSKVLLVNAVGTFNVSRLAAEKIALNEADEDGLRGVIINTASIAAYEGQVGQAAYAASKGAVVAMTLPLARDLAQHGIRVNTIAPGLMMTPMLEGLPESVQKDLASTVLLPKRLGKPDEFAKLVQSIIENSMINGEVIRLDGGLRMQP
jgi:3-hydroxyacyl-CoA dehydrogenase / 3-hydroxy-2-methylbutyryl-CoA dehydrogenase